VTLPTPEPGPLRDIMIAKGLRLAVLWLAIVLLLGTAHFGPQQTQRYLGPMLRALAPWMPWFGIQTLHAAVRKLSHITEYALLALFWLRALRAQWRLGLRTAFWVALAVCVSCAIVDEVHQTQVPGRHGSASDVVLDSLGAVAMLLIVRSHIREADGGMAPADARRPLGPVHLDDEASPRRIA
jgi:hypothetical protein